MMLWTDELSEVPAALGSLTGGVYSGGGRQENGDLGQDKYDALQREIVETEEELRRLEQEAQNATSALSKIDEAGKKLEQVGDKVFLQTVYNFAGAGEQVGFDVFRFDTDGRIAEHWDNLAAKAEPNPSGHTQIDGTLEKKDADKEETRKVVAGFVGDVLRGENPDRLTSYYDGDKYIQHNTAIADGLSGLGAALAAMAEQGITMVYNKTHMVLADGDYGLACSEGSFGGVPTTYYDLFRVEKGFIAEHWDVMETLADKDTWQNQNGKF